MNWPLCSPAIWTRSTPANRRPDVVDVLSGIGVSAGVAIGPLHRVALPPALPPALPIPAAAAGKPAVAEILRAQAMMVDDPVLRDAVVAAVKSGDDAPHAVHRAFAGHREAFAAAGGYLAERVADLDDLRDRTVAVLLGA